MIEFMLTRKERELLLEYATTLDGSLRSALGIGFGRGGGPLRLRGPREVIERIECALDDACETVRSRPLRRALQRLQRRLESCLSKQEGDFSPPASGGPIAEIQNEVRHLLKGQSFGNVEEANQKLREFYEGHNRRPRAEFGGLSPNQLRRLLDADWKSADSVVALNDAIPFSDLANIEIFANARIVLQSLIETDGTKATAAGNLNRKFIDEMARSVHGLDFFLHDFYKWIKTPNEDDFVPLSVLRHTMQHAGLVRKTKGKFRATKKAEKLMAEKMAGTLYILLFRAFFQEFNLAYLDRFPECGGLQQTIAYSFRVIGKQAQDWITPEALATEAILPAVSSEIPLCSYSDEPYDASILTTRIIRPLVRFGLLDLQFEDKKKPIFHHAIKSVRKTPLFDAFFSFRFDEQ